jgi:hypothetical protein
VEQGPTFRITMPKYPTADPNYRILANQRSRFTHYYFYIRDEVLGPMVIRVASFFPFQTTYYLNGHSFIERELSRAQIGFRKNDNALPSGGRCRRLAGRGRPAKPGHHPQATRLLDPDRRAEILRQGAQRA